jgi:hypothetical protein
MLFLSKHLHVHQLVYTPPGAENHPLIPKRRRYIFLYGQNKLPVGRGSVQIIQEVAQVALTQPDLGSKLFYYYFALIIFILNQL